MLDRKVKIMHNKNVRAVNQKNLPHASAELRQPSPLSQVVRTSAGASSLPSTRLSDDIVDMIAKEIGKTVASHIETMYPEAASAAYSAAYRAASINFCKLADNAVKMMEG